MEKAKCLHCNNSLTELRSGRFVDTPWGDGVNKAKYIRRYHKECQKEMKLLEALKLFS